MPTLEDVKKGIQDLKVKAYDNIRMSRDVNPKHMGHKTYGDYAIAVIEETAKKVEKILQKWEKENP